ncbi:MAG: metal-dependent hydrolase [Thermoanaerobaculia bacterium]
MNPITHALVGWCLAESVPGLQRPARAAVVLSSIAPDLDGFGLPFELATRASDHPLLWWTEYHHILGHNLVFASVVSLITFTIVRSRRLLVAALAFLGANVHFLCDLLGSRGPDGYQWPIPYLLPFSSRELVWSGQWALNAWQNVALTLVLLATTFALAWARGHSPLDLISTRADDVFVSALRRRWPRA